MKNNITDHPLYRVWDGIIQRCTNPKAANYARYGGRGISVCDEWKSSTIFLEWADTQEYQDGFQIERIDVNGNYCAENCKFVPHQEQYLNKRNTILMEQDGIVDSLSGWAKRLGISKHTLHNRYRSGWTHHQILNTPVGADKQ